MEAGIENENPGSQPISPRCEATRDAAFHLRIGARLIMEQLWVPSTTDEVWSLATVNAVAPDGKTADVIVNGAKKTVPMQTAHPWDPSHDGDFDDVGKMGDLHEAPLLAMLEKRYARDAIYTWSGEIRVAQPVPPDRSPTTRRTCRSTATRARRPPHIFAVADRAYALLRQGVAAQALVVNGEVGAGKTGRRQRRYISEASSATRRASTATAATSNRRARPATARRSAVIANVERTPACTSSRRLNAKTIRNNNSSRFGKLTWLLSPSGTPSARGSRRPDRSRPARRARASATSRSSIMAAGLPKTSEVRPATIGLAGDGYAALTHACTTADGIDDAAGFGELVAALKELRSPGTDG